jgi:3-hydroxyisobutyrate dehydrogenase
MRNTHPTSGPSPENDARSLKGRTSMNDQPSDNSHPPRPKETVSSVAVLGTGIMGAAMARNLLAAGLPTTVWDRSPSATKPLVEAGATAATSPAEAAGHAQVLITMLPTAEITSEVVFDGDVAAALPARAVWAQMGTIGVPQTTELAARLAGHRPDVTFVDAPVSGSKGPAESGHLLIFASGPPQAQPVVAPAFDAVGRKTLWLGDAGQGSRMKLVVNAYLSVLIEGVAETLALARHLDIDIAHLNAAIEGGPLDAPIADAKLHKMESADFAPEFPLQGALKDVDLAILSAESTPVPLLAALSRQWHLAVNAGHGRQDISAAILALSGQT